MTTTAPRRTVLLWAALLAMVPCGHSQEAAGEITGVLEIHVDSGEREPFTPFLLPGRTAAGTVGNVITPGQAEISWRGQTDALSDSAWLATTSGALGGTFQGYTAPGATSWNYHPIFPVSFAANDLAAGTTLAAFPFWSVTGLGELATSGLPHVSTTPEAADQIQFSDATYWADANGGAPLWRSLTDPAPVSPVHRSAEEPAFYRRGASFSRTLVLQGTPRQQYAAFILMPGQSTWLFRPDGRDFYLRSASTAKYSSITTSGIVGGPDATSADQVEIWSAALQAWETFFYSTTLKKWQSLSRPMDNVLAAGVKVPAGSSFRIRRAATNPPLRIPYPAITNLASTTPVTFPIVDLDRDKMADAWENAHGGTAMLPTADLDGDGLNSLAEFLLGGNPNVFDRPGLIRAEIRPASGFNDRSAWVSFRSVKGCRYRLETRRATESSWRKVVNSVIAGDGTDKIFQDTSYVPGADRITRFYRVVGLAPLDTDGDSLSDYEEETAYGTSPSLADTDLDGFSDGLEARSTTRNPLEYYDGRIVTLAAVSGDRQFGPRGEWLRESLTVKATSGSTILKNAPITFVIAKGPGGALSTIPGGGGSDGNHLVRVRTDINGLARVWLKLGATSDPLQIRATARVSNSVKNTLYTANFMIYPTEHLTMPAGGLLAWFRPDTGIVMDSEAKLTAWESRNPLKPATAGALPAPKWTTYQNRPWITFSGTERLDLGSAIADNTFELYFAAAPTKNRTAAAQSLTSLSAGNSGQTYLFGPDVPTGGSSVVIFKAPAKPTSFTFSLWRQTNLFLTASYPGYTRPYVFQAAAGRQDDTDGFRVGPGSIGRHTTRGGAYWAEKLARDSGRFANYTIDYTRTSSRSLQHLGVTYAVEDFYRVDADRWRGNPETGGFGGEPVFEYSRVGTVGFGLSVGANSMGAFELRNGWAPAVTGSAATSSTGFIGAARVASRVVTLDSGGLSLAASAASKSTLMNGPRYLGGTSLTTNRYVGHVGDILMYDRSLNEGERQLVEDHLAAVYRPAKLTDRDKDTLADWWERCVFGNRNALSTQDGDNDTASNSREQAAGSHPLMADSDSDGTNDGTEITRKQNPANWDSDHDLLPDTIDLKPTDPSNGRADADSNGRSDGEDYLLATPTGLEDRNTNGIPDLLE